MATAVKVVLAICLLVLAATTLRIQRYAVTPSEEREFYVTDRLTGTIYECSVGCRRVKAQPSPPLFEWSSQARSGPPSDPD